MREYFQALEDLPHASKVELTKTLQSLCFNESGLIPVITQDTHSKEVLMLAWMNTAAIEKTLNSGLMTYWSRSRKKFWLKGETSGHFQRLKHMRIDCDGDAVVCLVEQTGAACHTGRPSCFYLDIDVENKTLSVMGDPAKS